MRTPGTNGIGLKVEKGDKIVVPSKFLQLAANPLKGSGHFTRLGLTWFAEHVFGVDIASRGKRNSFSDVLGQFVESNERFFRSAPCLEGLDLENADQADEVWKRLNENPKSIEWWGYLAASFGSLAIDSIKDGNASDAAWAATVSERFRALAIFKSHFEEVVFMGHSAGRLIELLKVWDTNRQNSSEGYWQQTLEQHTFAFSQLFSVPVTFIEGTAYVGGTKLDGGDARYLDFMFSGGSANHAILIEIKTPTTPLLHKRKYRKSVYAPSRELAGSIVQVNDYLDTLRRNIDGLTRDKNMELNTFNPKRIVLIGNAELELTDIEKRGSFELFRSSLNGVDVITFDEFFRKVRDLAKLFNLIPNRPNLEP